MDDQTFAPHLHAVRNYLCSQRWQRDPSSGQCERYVFNSDVDELARAFHEDKPHFPKTSVCALVTNPVGDLLALAVEVIAPELFPGEFAVVKNALEIVCAIEEETWTAVKAALAVPVAAASVAYLVGRGHPSPRPETAVLSLPRPSRPPQHLTRASRR